MAINALAVHQPPGPTADNVDYRPGSCNIGPDEIGRRMRIGHVGLAATVALLALLLVSHAPPLARFLVALPAAAAAAGYLQALFRFCVAFGWEGVFNFGRLGSTRDVADRAARAADRRRAARLSVAIAGIALATGAAAALLPF